MPIWEVSIQKNATNMNWNVRSCHGGGTFD